MRGIKDSWTQKSEKKVVSSVKTGVWCTIWHLYHWRCWVSHCMEQLGQNMYISLYHTTHGYDKGRPEQHHCHNIPESKARSIPVSDTLSNKYNIIFSFGVIPHPRLSLPTPRHESPPGTQTPPHPHSEPQPSTPHDVPFSLPPIAWPPLSRRRLHSSAARTS